MSGSSFRADVIGCSVNHTSSHHYPGMPKFLFYEKETREYRIYDPEKDGEWVVDGDIFQPKYPVEKRNMATSQIFYQIS